MSTARAAVFLDRDGVVDELVTDPETNRPESPLHPADVRLLPGAAAAVQALQDAGYAVVCVTNQPAAAKGRVPVEELKAVHQRVIELLAGDGVRFDAWRMCLHHPEGTVEALATACNCRKPAPGMLVDSAADLGIDLIRSWAIGDSDVDVLAGAAAGCRTVLVEHPASAHRRAGGGQPDARVATLGEATQVVLSA